MSEYQFGLGEGHLPKKADKIARKFGAELINYTEPNGHKRHWFTGPNYGNPHDQQMAEAVLAELRAAKILSDPTHCKHNVELGYGACHPCAGKTVDQIAAELAAN